MKKDIGKRAANVLLVEDNSDSIFMTQEALKEIKSDIRLFVVEDGAEAMHFLHPNDKYKDCVRPDLILLDLNLPKKDGQEILAECKTDDNLKMIPVIILTTSQSAEDIKKAYSHHANCYITKPVDLDEFIHMMKSMLDFWLTVVSLPGWEGGQ